MHSFLSTLVAAWGATFLIETAVISVALSSRHGWRIRLFSGIWLSACTLPLVWFVLPECLLFWRAFIHPLPRDTVATIRDCLAITAANAASFSAGALFWP